MAKVKNWVWLNFNLFQMMEIKEWANNFISNTYLYGDDFCVHNDEVTFIVPPPATEIWSIDSIVAQNGI